jgi:hypothetical protein
MKDKTRRLQALEKGIKEPVQPVVEVTYTDGREHNLRPIGQEWAVVQCGQSILSVIPREFWEAL